MLNGRFIGKNGSISDLGRGGFNSVIATANDPRYSDGQGTFETSDSLWNRFAIILNPANPLYAPTSSDKMFIDMDLPSLAGVVGSRRRDLTRKIINAQGEIVSGASVKGMSPEAESAYHLIRSGLAEFQDGTVKDSHWFANYDPANPQDLWNSVRNPSNTRMMKNIERYASALKFLSRLKDPNADIPESEFVLRAFELNSAYQPRMLNPNILNSQDYKQDNHKLMRDVVDSLRGELAGEKGQRLCEVIAGWRKGQDTKFYEIQGRGDIYALDSTSLSEKEKEHLREMDPEFNNQGNIAYGWVDEVSKDRRALYQENNFGGL